MKRLLLVLVVAGISVTGLAAQAQSAVGGSPPERSPLSVLMQPTFDIPLGESAQLFTVGGSVDAGVLYSLGTTPVSLFGGIAYSFVPVKSNESLSIAAGQVGALCRLPIGSAFSIDAFGASGYYYGTFNDFSVGSANPYAAGGARLGMRLSPSWQVDIGALYRSYFGLYQGIGVTVGAALSLEKASPRPARSSAPPSKPSIEPLGSSSGGATLLPTSGGLTIKSPELEPIFPVFYKYYDDHPIGTIEITNGASTAATDVAASVYIKQYMDTPKESRLAAPISPGSKTSLELFALFTDSVLSVTEGTKVAAEITLSYTIDGRRYQEQSAQTLRFYNRNAMTWDDDRRPAAFVTAKDPAVLTLSKSVTGLIRSKEVRSINKCLQTAIALHETLDLYGLNYVPDPTTPFAEYSKDKAAVDFLQFPRQTLQYRAGDCDDLSILYAALFEAVGIHAAFITTPGHIFVAFDSGVSPKEAVDMLLPADQFIVQQGHAWIPVEITLRHQGFQKAWEQGAKEWKQAQPLGLAGFHPVQEAWTAFEPVGLPGAADVSVPSSDAVLAAYLSEVTSYIDQALFPQIAALQAQVRANGSLSAMNKLGVLYAKYGQPDKARVEFEQILSRKSNHLPALLNLGNMAYLSEDWLSAQKYYGRAADIDPNNAHVLLAVARVNQELENYGTVKRSYTALQKADPALAQQHGYLALGAKADSTRAADTMSQ